MTIRGIPPGRAGRLWLERRTHAARSAADVLDRKLRILRAEQDRLEAAARGGEDSWQERHAEAEIWLLRAALLGHRRGLRAAAARPEAGLVLGRATVAGVGYPVVLRFAVPEPPAGAPPAASAAIGTAAAAVAAALEAAVDYAVREAAVQAVREEVASTRARLHAVEDRWLPWLEQRTRAVSSELDEQERAEATLLRWAGDRAASRRR